MLNKSITVILFLFFLAACTPAKQITSSRSQTISGLKFLGEYDVPNAKQFKGTTIGGLSGIDYDPKEDLYYLICDDRSAINPARFYTAGIYFTSAGIDSVQFLDVVTLKDKNGKAYPNSKQDPFHTPDPEAMRYNSANDELVWSSEGERNTRDGVFEDPGIYIIDKNGNYKDSFLLPANMHMRPTENGPRQNGVFEGLSFSGNHKHLFVSVEEPIYEDGPRAGLKDSTGRIRILKFDANNHTPVAQYSYRIEAVATEPTPGGFKINGIPDILWVSDKEMLVIERSFSTGKLACTIKVFLTNLDLATNVMNLTSVLYNNSAIPAPKKLLLNMDDLGRYIDNIEGVTFGPKLPNGHRTLIFVADDNFSANEKTQFLLFEVIP